MKLEKALHIERRLYGWVKRRVINLGIQGNIIFL